MGKPTLPDRSAYKAYAPLDNPEIVMQGIHPARLIEVKRFSNPFGERIGLVFNITDGTFADSMIMDSASIKSGAQGKLRDLLNGLGGGDLSTVELLVGQECQIAVKHERDRSGNTYAAVSNTYPIGSSK